MLPEIPTSSIYLAIAAMLAPMVAFSVILVLSLDKPRFSARLSIIAISISFICAITLLAIHRHMAAPLTVILQRIIVGDTTLVLGLLLDPLGLLMLVIVCGISLLVQIYSLGYMAGDPGYARYFGFMSFFAWAMICLTLSSTLLELYIFWELVGLASYLLIGFWFEKFSASEAGKKAFVMTRLGDVAFLLGLLVVLTQLGNLDILAMNRPAVAEHLQPGILTLSALLIFGGIIGKSAQFPLLTWLPDAMEGPTPVSALLHSATMVAAGVFLMGRLFPFFSMSPTALSICLAVGTLSMLMAGTMAMVSDDIKQVLAFSTISQLGYMVMALSAGGYFPGIFHLTTHAGFKALLFLCSGVFIHAFHTNDMETIARHGGRRMPVAMVCLIIGGGALAGLPPFSGFFSKEAIIGTLAQLENPLWVSAGILGAFITAYYTFRMIFILAFPRKDEERPSLRIDTPLEDNQKRHGHGRSWSMEVPLMLLAGITLVIGFFHGSLEHFLNLKGMSAALHETPNGVLWVPRVTLSLIGIGILLAWWEFGRKGASHIGFIERWPSVHSFFADRWYLDRIYRIFLDLVIYGMVSRIFTFNDRNIIDGALDGLAQTIRNFGQLSAKVQEGMIQYRLMTLFAVMICTIFVLILV
jgi:NADH-quinone oxidoreductase subunit L